MTEAATILVPVDFSTHSRAAVERACGLAKASGAGLRFLHALHIPALDLDFAYSEAVWSDLRKLEKGRLEELRIEFEDRLPSVSTIFEERYPADAIYAAGRTPGVELIVMGSHGRRGLNRLLLGSVTERTLHAGLGPILVVREDEAEAVEPIERILFATDFSESAMRAERVVSRWARLLGAEVEIFHAIRETTVLFAPYAVSGSSDYEGEMKEAATRRIEGCQERLRKDGVSAKSKIVYGFASEEILKRAESSRPQLIAMGTRGYSGIQRFKLGSVVQRVLQQAPCDVLVAGSGPGENGSGMLDDDVESRS